jgi:hypothetical protein
LSKILYAFLISPLHVICSTHHIRDLIVLIIFILLGILSMLWRKIKHKFGQNHNKFGIFVVPLSWILAVTNFTIHLNIYLCMNLFCASKGALFLSSTCLETWYPEHWPATRPHLWGHAWHKKWRTTKLTCSDCKVGLCVRPMFCIYYTKINF